MRKRFVLVKLSVKSFILSLVLLMVQKSLSQPLIGCIKPVVNNGINYQPQLVRRISEPSTVAMEHGP